MPVIEQALHDSPDSIRAAAARALRLAPGSDIDRLLATVITSDSDSGARGDAIFAARFRHPLPTPLAEAMLEAASTDPTRFVRSDAIALLSQNPTASLKIPDALNRIAQQDADPGIRHQAEEALRSISLSESAHQ